MELGNLQNSWRPLTLLAVVLAVILFVYPMTLGIPLLDPDEGLHAAVAQEMVEGGDWVIPHFLGEPFLDKPILYFWAEALSLRMFGMHEAAVRFAGLMFGLLGAVTTGIVAWRMFGRGVGLVAGMFYATTILPTALAQAAAHDVALIPWINLSLLLFWESDRAQSGRRAWLCAMGIGVLLGLAILTKGLVGVALVGISYGCYLLATRRLGAATCLRGAATLVIAAMVAAVWYLAVEARNPGYLYYYVVERHLLGYATDTQTHGGKPWWFYLPIILGGGLPWIGYLPVVIRDGWYRRRSGDEKAESNGAMALLWCWLMASTILLSAASSKMVTYIWPIFPAVAILAAVGWVRLIDGTLSSAARKDLARTFWPSCVAGPVLLPLVMLVVQAEFSIRFSALVWVVAMLAAASSWLPLVFWIRGRLRATLGSAMLATAAQFAVVMAVVLPQIAPGTSARRLAEHFNRQGRIPPRLLVVDERIGSLVFYLDPQLRAGLRKGQIEYVRLGEILDSDTLLASSDTVLVLPDGQLKQIKEHIDLGGADFRQVGRHGLYKARQLRQIPRTASSSGGTTR